MQQSQREPKKDFAEIFQLDKKKERKSPENQPPCDDTDEDYDATRNPPNREPLIPFPNPEPNPEPSSPPPETTILVLITLAFDGDAVTVAAWYFGILRDLRRRRRCRLNVC